MLDRQLKAFRSQPRLVRVFAYLLIAVLVISGLSSMGDFARGFSAGFAASQDHAENGRR